MSRIHALLAARAALPFVHPVCVAVCVAVSHTSIWSCRYTGTLTRENTHLICKIKGGAKYERAVEWGIEIVDDGWLFEDDVKKREEYEERERERAAEVKRVETERNLEMLKKLESSTVRSSKKLRRQREGSSGGAGSMLPPPKKVVRRTESPKSESPQKRSNPTDYEEDAVEGSQFISWRN